MSRVLFLFMFSLSDLVRSINGQTGCGSSGWTDQFYTNFYNQMYHNQQVVNNFRKMSYKCDDDSVSDGAALLVLLLILVLIVSGDALCIWCICVQRQKAIIAANFNNAPGQVVEAQVAHGTETNLNAQTSTVREGDPNHQV